MPSIKKNIQEEYNKTEFCKFMSKGEFDNYIDISVQSSYIYVSTAKVASTSIRKKLKTIEAEILGISPPQDARSIHEKNVLLSPSFIGFKEFSEMLSNKKVFKFIFVRNPYTRVLSAYLDKIARKNDNKARKIFTQRLSLDPNEDMSFKQFLHHLKKQSPRIMDPHWKPQTTYLFGGLIDYHFIGYFENFERDFKQMLKLIYPKFQEESFENKKKAGGHHTHSQSRLRDFYNNQTQELVYEIYKEDFYNFNYSIELPPP